MEKEEIKEQENSGEEKNKKLNPDTALKIMAGLIIFMVVFLLLMRYTDKNGISKNEIVFSTGIEILTEPETDTLFTVNINTADKDELIKLPGIGEKKAEAIIEYRKEYGYFYKPEELMNISGISTKTYDKLKDFVITE